MKAMVSRLAPQLEVEETPIERQRLVDVANLQRHMIEAHGAGLIRVGHSLYFLHESVVLLSYSISQRTATEEKSWVFGLY